VHAGRERGRCGRGEREKEMQKRGRETRTQINIYIHVGRGGRKGGLGGERARRFPPHPLPLSPLLYLLTFSHFSLFLHSCGVCFLENELKVERRK